MIWFLNAIQRLDHIFHLENNLVVSICAFFICFHGLKKYTRWDSPDFLHKRISDELRETLTQCGLQVIPLGITYTADRLNEEGLEITSAIDHIFICPNVIVNIQIQYTTQ